MSFLTGLQAAQDVVSTLVRPTRTGITSGETMFDPANWHGHQGNNDIFVLTRSAVDFQLFRSHDDLTFIYGSGDVASFWGGGNQTIYDNGSGTILRFSELEGAKVNVYGLDHDRTARIVFYNAADPTIRPDGQGGTLINGVDFLGARISPAQVSFLHSGTPLSLGGLVPV
ncbi:MAG TPA: hypothetical protein VE690_13495 [Rhodopila sp.]|nr:hypothetical protein [Rhodopila sp.]